MARYYHWLGASADAKTGSRADASSPQAVSTKGFDPARVGAVARASGDEFFDAGNRRHAIAWWTLACAIEGLGE